MRPKRALRATVVMSWMMALLGVTLSAAETGVIEQRLQEELAKANTASLSVGIVHGDRLVYHHGVGWADREKKRKPNAQTVYRIGSVTKVFTTTLMMILRDEGVLRLDDPIAKYLPAEVVLPHDPRGAPQITFRHLATHTSGLPRNPVNLPAKAGDPFAGFSKQLLYEGLAKTKLVSPIGSQCLYSNLGMGLLGHVLSLAAGESYDSLLASRLFKPLDMKGSVTVDDGDAFARGYLDGSYEKKAEVWHLGEIAPAGVIGSNVADMARFLSLQFRAGEAGVSPVHGHTLAELHRPQWILDGWRRAMGLGWVVNRNEDGELTVWHNGGLDGFHTMTCFSPAHKLGVVVLSTGGRGVDQLGLWLLAQAKQQFGADQVHAGAQASAEQLANYFVAKPGDEMGKLFHGDFLTKIPLAQIKPVMAAQFSNYGKCLGVEKLKPTAQKRRIEIVYKFEKASRRCILEVDNSPEPKIVYLLFPD